MGYSRQHRIGAALYRAVRRLEAMPSLEPPAQKLSERVTALLGSGALRDGLKGMWLGHAFHPVLTDFTDGAWIGTSFLDLFGGEDAAPAAQRLLGFGLVAAVPTVLSGLAEWADCDGKERRVGLVHAATNGTAIILYGTSYLARRRGRRIAGVALGLAGGIVATADGYVGGHLSHVRGVGVGQTALEREPAGE